MKCHANGVTANYFPLLYCKDLTDDLHAIVAEDEDGNAFPLWVTAVDDEQVLVDSNHPLAGETLHFEVEVVGIRDATSEEQAHG